MQCPQCGCEMECGQLSAHNAQVLWTDRPLKLTGIAGSNDVVIKPQRFLNEAGGPPAYLCRRCHLVLVKY